MLNIILTGVGGQGTVLASKIIARCAIEHGEHARTAETIGMAQRGGSVVSHVRIGERVFSPLIPKRCADVLIGFEPSEAVRALPFLKKNGIAVVSSSPVKPVTDSLSNTEYSAEEMIEYLKGRDIKLYIVDGDDIVKKCGSPKSLNIGLLGAAAKTGAIGITADELEKIINSTLSPRFREANISALRAGIESMQI